MMIEMSKPKDPRIAHLRRKYLVNPRVKRLLRALHRRDNLSEDYLRILRKLVATRDRAAALVVAGMLDMPGIVGDAAVRGLVEMAHASRACAGTVFEECLLRAAGSIDEDDIRNSHRVLAALGRQESVPYVSAYCWADIEGEGGAPDAEPVRRAA